MNWMFLFFIGCNSSGNNEECQQPAEEESFEVCFEDSWCTAWQACGFEEDCQTTKPWTTHYENGDGTMDNDCEPAGSTEQWSQCIQRIRSSNCAELKEAAQNGTENPLWIDVCLLKSCV